jgi:hypothetical protein
MEPQLNRAAATINRTTQQLYLGRTGLIGAWIYFLKEFLSSGSLIMDSLFLGIVCKTLLLTGEANTWW